MKVLFLTPQLPYPPISGGVIKSYRLVKFLADAHELSICCFLKGESDEQNLEAFKTEIGNVPVYSKSLNIARTPLNFARSCLNGSPLTIYRNKSHDFKSYIKDIAHQFDVIFVDLYLMFQYVPADFKGRVVVHQQNAEFLMWSRMAEQTSNLLLKSVLAFEAWRIRRYEVNMCAKAHAVLAAPNDQQALIDAGAAKHNLVDTYHLGDEENFDLPAMQFNQTKAAILFVGTLSWEANADGLVWFLESVWPLIKAKAPGVTFTVVGKHSKVLGDKLLKLAPDIILAGFVDDLESLYHCNRVFVAPLRFGSGIKVKVVNGLYRGIPTVATSVGAEGLDKLVSGEHLFVEDSPTGFADAVVTLLNEHQIWQQMSEQSRRVMQAHYTWDVVFDYVQKSLEG